MAATGPGLREVLDLGLDRRRGGPLPLVGGSFRDEILKAIPPVRPFGSALLNPFERMFGTRIGDRARYLIGNESRTLAALDRLAVEAIATMLQETRAHWDERLLVMPRQKDGWPIELGAPIVMLMSPNVQHIEQTRNISAEVDLPFPQLLAAMRQVTDPEQNTPETIAFRELMSDGGSSRDLAQLLFISQPQIILTRRPRMIPLCVSSPHLKLQANGKTSTAGIFCRNREGALGLTGCYHGTGPAGTPVSVGTDRSSVKSTNETQDIVFIPLQDGFKLPKLVGLGGVLIDCEPARADKVKFDGATNQNRQTRIFGADNGLLRARPTVQLKVQTDPDTDEGDSGSALIDEHDHVIGFAFERTDYDDYPQFTDWIWAANALRALNLTPI
jgi:hypothetical protein